MADIEGMVKNLTAEKQQSEFALVLTDDFTDLLLAGTEVAGSCQRIGGDPELNKCLLAWLWMRDAGDNYPGSAALLGGVAPYEYVDADGGVKNESRFEIRGAKLVSLN